MKKYSIWAMSALIFVCLFATKCRPEECEDGDCPEENNASLRLMIQTDAGDDSFYLDSAYVTGNADTIYVSKCKFYVSNVMLVDSATADTFRVTDSYHLYDRSNGSMNMWTYSGLAEGTYDRVVLSIGIDSTANLNSDHTEGDLNPTGDMVWNWSTGYKFLRIEGKHGADTLGNFSFHIGHEVNYQTLELKLDHGMMSTGSSFSLENDTETEVHIMADVLQLFAMPNNIDLDVSNSQTGLMSTKDPVAENYSNHFLMLHHAGN